MARTFKDSRLGKSARKHPEKSNAKKFKDRKQWLSSRFNSDDFCPSCGSHTSFSDGFLVCTDCNWSTFETQELDFSYPSVRAA